MARLEEVDETVLHQVVDRGRSLGASYVEARYHDNYGYSVSTRNMRVLGVEYVRERGVGVRVIVDGSLGFAATSDLTKEGLLKALEVAVTRARAASRLRKVPIEFSEERLGVAKYSVIEKKPLQDYLTPVDALNLLLETYKQAVGTLKEAKLAVMTGRVRVAIESKIIVNSDGGLVKSVIPRPYVSIGSTLLHQRGTIQRYAEFGASGGAEKVDEWRVPEEVSSELARLEKVLVKGVKPPSEKLDVVLGQEVVGLIVHESAGHPMEADRILGREAAQAGESYVKPSMIGEFRVGNKYATVVEDPTIPGSYGFYLYDDECVRARPRYLYREGLLYEPLHNRHTARIFKVQSNGAARSMNYASEPIIRMSNTYLAPGDMSFEELIEDVELGIYVKSYMEWNIDDARWNQRYVGLEAYLIKNGELAEPVMNPVLEFTTGWFYSNIVGVDKNLEFYPGTCGKGEPSQGVPVWFGGPNVRLAKMKVGVLE
ncbi:MAG: TldD/PmbA family protein [Desulfurococcaceae archaeon]